MPAEDFSHHGDPEGLAASLGQPGILLLDRRHLEKRPALQKGAAAEQDGARSASQEDQDGADGGMRLRFGEKSRVSGSGPFSALQDEPNGQQIGHGQHQAVPEGSVHARRQRQISHLKMAGWAPLRRLSREVV